MKKLFSRKYDQHVGELTVCTILARCQAEHVSFEAVSTATVTEVFANAFVKRFLDRDNVSGSEISVRYNVATEFVIFTKLQALHNERNSLVRWIAEFEEIPRIVFRIISTTFHHFLALLRAIVQLLHLLQRIIVLARQHNVLQTFFTLIGDKVNRRSVGVRQTQLLSIRRPTNAFVVQCQRLKQLPFAEQLVAIVPPLVSGRAALLIAHFNWKTNWPIRRENQKLNLHDTLHWYCLPGANFSTSALVE